MLFPVRTQRALTNRNNLKSTSNPFPYLKRGQLLQTAWGTRRSLEEALNPSDQFSSVNLLSHQERPWEDLATLWQWSQRYPKPQKFPKSLPAKGHNGLSQPWVPSTKSQTASLVSLNRLLGKSYWQRREERGTQDRKKEHPLPQHSCGGTASFLCSDNETQKRSTGQRKLHKSSTALSLAQGQLSSCVGVKRNKELFTDFWCPKMGQQLMNSDLGGLGNVHSLCLWIKSLL